MELTLAVATTKPETFARRLLEHAGLLRHFQSVHGATLDGSVRYKDQVVRAALIEVQVEPGVAVLIGDRDYDVVGARTCGVACIGAGWGYGSRAELEAAGAAAVARQPRDVVALMAQHLGRSPPTAER